jgi:hypothetical protein
MKIRKQNGRRWSYRAAAIFTLIVTLVTISTRLRADTGTCNGGSVTIPFTDVPPPPSNIFFCAIAEAFFSGLTNGTSATTYSPSANVSREQMAAFITRTLDQSLRRGSRRAAMGQWWTPQTENNLGLTTVQNGPAACATDGVNVWVANALSDSISRVAAATGAVSATVTDNISLPGNLLLARGKVFGLNQGGSLVSINPALAGLPTTVEASNLGTFCSGLAYDGDRLWVVSGGANVVSAVRLDPFSVQTITGFVDPRYAIFDGAHVWVTDDGDDSIKKIDPSDGSIDLTVTLTNGPGFIGKPTFDGTNLWIPTSNDKLYIVRAATTTDTVLQVLTGNGLDFPTSAAFDGARVLVGSASTGTRGLSLWKASSLTPIDFIPLPSNREPSDICSDGANFWVTLSLGPGTPGFLARF